MFGNAESLKKATILIVDDRPLNREYLSTVLGATRHRLLEAAAGAEALAIARSEHPDLIITDILMPTMDGYEFVRQLRTDPAIADTKVIFYTAHHNEQGARGLARHCGVSTILAKGTEPDIVLSVVESVLGQASATDPLPTIEDFHRKHLRVLTDKLADSTERLRTTDERLVLEEAIGHQNAITRKRLETALHASEAHKALILASIGDAVISTDAEGRVTFMNGVAEALTGWPQAEAMGLPLPEVFHILNEQTGRPTQSPALRAMDLETVVLLPEHTVLIARDGTERPISDSAAPLQGEAGNPLGAVIVFRDVTERVRAEEALRSAHGALEERVQERTIELRQSLAENTQMLDRLRTAGAELTRSNQDLKQFASVASHDLQEPLRKVSIFAQLLAAQYKGKLDANADEIIGSIVNGAGRMQNLIQSLLLYARLGRAGQPFAPTDCNAVLKQALANLQGAIEASGAVIEIAPLPTLLADENQLVQLFQNLIGNAVKFHGADKPLIHVQAEPTGPVWTFSVQDNGIGVDSQFGERIFLIFQRLHGREEYSGTGIGLAVCKKVVDLHGGRIWLESRLPVNGVRQGATFCFTLPRSLEPEEPPHEKSER